MTTCDIYEGLEAIDTVTLYDVGRDEEEEDDTIQEFGDAVEQHLSWVRHYESIFISLFSQRRHAENWMLDRHKRLGSRNCTLLQIDTTTLNGFFIFRAQEIVDALSLSTPEAAQASVAGEYLIAHYIPPRAIIRSQTVDDIIAGKLEPFEQYLNFGWKPIVPPEFWPLRKINAEEFSAKSTSSFHSTPFAVIA